MNWIFIIHILAALALAAQGVRYDLYSHCCKEGKTWGAQSFRCGNYPAPVANVSDSEQTICLSVIEVCCMKQSQSVACNEGKLTALDSQLCAIRDTDAGAEIFRECCQCCRLGISSRPFNPTCEPPGLGQPCDSKYSQCCLGQVSVNLTFYGVTRAPNNLNQNKKDEKDLEKTDRREARHLVDENGNNIKNGYQYKDTEIDDTGLLVRVEGNGDRIHNEVKHGGQDVDECNLFPGQVCSHTCINTVQGFYCSCPEGLILDPLDNRTCIVDVEDKDFTEENSGLPENSVDEAANCELRNPCDHQCVNMAQGGIRCRCFEGYKLDTDGASCLDIDECAQGSARCAPSQRCVNTLGRYTCMTSRCPPGYQLNQLTGQCEVDIRRCQAGFAFNTVTSRCEDLNECGLGTDHCGVGERCENTIGSYSCRRMRHCGTGYTLDESSQRCIDNDECRLGTHDCREAYNCQNSQGSYRCVHKPCESGFRFDREREECVEMSCPAGLRPNAGGKCVDIDECKEYSKNICKRYQRCVNTRGSYHCKYFVNCPTGYEPTDNNGCQDVDECARGTHKCGPEQQCVNRQGTYFCQCARGMRHDNSGRCVDVDECSYGAAICPSNSKCVNTIGSYSCQCVDGLVDDGNNACADVDECEQDGLCHQKCVNVPGTFFCSCNRGYQLRDDKRSCEDIDECTQFGSARGGGVCGGTCINMAGSFRCDCPDGWSLKSDGRSCEDNNECLDGTAYCPHTESMCINTRGGYKCPVIRCPQGFIRTNTSQPNSIRCKRVSTNCAECRKGLISRTYNFLSFASDVSVPAPLFSMTGSRLADKFYTWSLDLISAQPLRAGVPAATDDNFSLEKSLDYARVSLVNQIVGPQDVVLRMTMNVTSYYRGYEGMAESRIYLYVTEVFD